MAGIGEAIEGIVALALGGLIFIVVGGAVSATDAVIPMVNLQLWGIIYVVTAVVLAVGLVYAAIRSIFE